MAKSGEKKSSGKKRPRKEGHTQGNKKRKHSKRTIDKTLVEEVPERQTISEGSPLSTARTIVTPGRTPSLTPRIDDRSRQLSNELEEVHQRSYLERMAEMAQSERPTINDIIRNELYYHTPEPNMQFTTPFTPINSRAQENPSIEENPSTQENPSIMRRQVTPQTSPIAGSPAAALNTVFDLEGFIPGLEAIICGKDGIEKGIPIGQVRTDPMPKRIVLASFNEGGAIMRRVVDYSSQGIKMDTKDPKYKVYRGASLKKGDIIYRLGWENLKDEEEGRKVFAAMAEKGWTTGWGIRSYDHLKKAKYIRSVVAASRRRQLLAQEGDDPYQENRGYVRNQANAEQLGEAMVKANGDIGPIARGLEELAGRSIGAGQNRIREIGDDFVELLARIADEAILALGHFQEGITKWKG
jgi:hypothetical protein